MESVNARNCKYRSMSDLRLPYETLAQIPRFNRLLSSIIYSNRTQLLHLHNMALNRAFYYSYILQKLNRTEDVHRQPGLMYYYLSTAADVSANLASINGSAVYFDKNTHYANWWKSLRFNKTMPYFAPRSWRIDDYDFPTNYLREPTNNTINVDDFGSGRYRFYDRKEYKLNEWYFKWMPDLASTDSVRKHSYDVGIKEVNSTGHFKLNQYEGKVFFGPPSPGQMDMKNLPVLFTSPYFDCGNSNKWIVSAVAPIVDQLPRYLEWFHLRRHKFVGVVVMDMDFIRIDLNPCPKGLGNPDPNYFHGISRCKPTTMCEPLHGYGYNRDGYQCVCKPGHRYPKYYQGPFQGKHIEKATNEQYETGFNCVKVGRRQVVPSIYGNITAEAELKVPYVYKKRRQLEQFNYTSKVEFIHNHRDYRSELIDIPGDMIPGNLKRMYSALLKKWSINTRNCQEKTKRDLKLTGDAAFDVERQFKPEAQTALRLAHFVSSFLQNVQPNEEYGNIRGDRYLNQDQLFGEVLANVMGNLKIKSSGIFFDYGMYEEFVDDELKFNVKKREYFAPYAYRYEATDEIQRENEREDFYDQSYRSQDRANTHFRAVDFAGFIKQSKMGTGEQEFTNSQSSYLDELWFRTVKERWQSNIYGMEKFTLTPAVRSNLTGTSKRRHENYPLYFYASGLEGGHWGAPFFDCNKMFINDWVVTYSVPFFDANALDPTTIEFKGIVTVSVKLDDLDINQCPGAANQANIFKNTALCHYESTFCVPISGRKYVLGSYKCECLQAFEYPFNDRAWYFDGQTLEQEYRKLVVKDKDSRLF
ncbi:hypothetical protein A3Q56_02519 [Intoshia linei]|uniref:GPR158/179 extracellular domain-containing protein n=1 Tax=Intoshia linei TaxID=1819745 RepID=A0A177B620_9BILA|nr:hypothetical protein A3Q56_02519 [Intoshia linei]